MFREITKISDSVTNKSIAINNTGDNGSQQC
jgi:hypothetical protein